MKLCYFEMYLDNYELYVDAYVDSSPEKDEEGNWKPILLKFNLKTIDKNAFQEIMSKFYNFNSDEKLLVKYGSATLSVDDDDDDIWNLYDVWPKSLKFDDESNCEILWRFNDAKLQE